MRRERSKGKTEKSKERKKKKIRRSILGNQQETHRHDTVHSNIFKPRQEEKIEEKDSEFKGKGGYFPHKKTKGDRNLIVDNIRSPK